MIIPRSNTFAVNGTTLIEKGFQKWLALLEKRKRKSKKIIVLCVLVLTIFFQLWGQLYRTSISCPMSTASRQIP